MILTQLLLNGLAGLHHWMSPEATGPVLEATSNSGLDPETPLLSPARRPPNAQKPDGKAVGWPQTLDDDDAEEDDEGIG